MLLAVADLHGAGATEAAVGTVAAAEDCPQEILAVDVETGVEDEGAASEWKV